MKIEQINKDEFDFNSVLKDDIDYYYFIKRSPHGGYEIRSLRAMTLYSIGNDMKCADVPLIKITI